jgi:hypothetical protein
MSLMTPPSTPSPAAPTTTSANQLALQSKAALEATGAFVVEPDGRVRLAQNRGGGYVPPWVWAPALTDDLTLRVSLATPSSDPSSPWRSAVPYSEGGPFTKRSQWDASNGTYDGGIDWGTLLGTVGVGALFAAPALAAAFAGGGGSAAGAGAGVGVGETGATAGVASATSLGLPTTAGLGTAGAASTAGAAGAAGTAAASGIPSLVRAGISAGAPLAIRALTNGSGSNGTSNNGLNAEQNDLLTQLIKMSMARQQESAPIHSAAMALAGQLAPTGSWGDSPRFNAAVQQTTGPGPAGGIQDPNIAAAYAKLMGGR